MKCMACRPPKGEHMPFEAFREAQKTFYFVNPDAKDVCYVAPYVIVLDGQDILARYATNDRAHVDIGWKFPVYYKRNVKDFDTLIEEGIKERFVSLWQGVRTMDKKPKGIEYDQKQGLIRKKGVKYVDLPDDQINVHTTNRGCYSLNKKRFHPVYFIVVPNTRPVNLIPADEDPENKPAYPINLKTLAADFGSVPLTYTARKIMEMITSGEVVLPIISGDPEWPE